MIRVENAAKSFTSQRGTNHVVRGLSFEVPADAHLMIVGPAGSGKSTVLNLIGGLVPPDAGKVVRAGTVSWVHGRMRLERSMSVSQNLRFLGRVFGQTDFARTDQLIRDLTGFTHQMKEQLDELTDEERKLLNAVMLVAFDFDIYLFDGPLPLHDKLVQDYLQPLFGEKMMSATTVNTGSSLREMKGIYTHFLLLGESDAQLYDNRRDAIEAFKKNRAGMEA